MATKVSYASKGYIALGTRGHLCSHTLQEEAETRLHLVQRIESMIQILEDQLERHYKA